jgi:hypothetical protein
MPTFQTKILINSLQQDVRNTLVGMEHLLHLPDDVLLQQPQPGMWSIAQVLEHLNGYNRYYLTEIEKALQVTTVSANTVFKSGWIGNYFTNLMLPKENGTLAKKMSSPKEYNFPPDLDAGRVVQEFIEGQQKLLVLLDKARNVDMGSIRVPISISKWIKLKLGDTFRFLIAHQLRHFIQIERTENAVLKNKAA